MEENYHLIGANQAIRLLQLTDMHLFADDDAQLLGVNTARSFQAVLDQIQLNGGEFDAVLATGDLIQDFNEAGYNRFARMVESLKAPVFWLQGNHDCPTSMPQKFTDYPHIFPHKQILAGEYWQILLLDSQVFGVPHGELSAHQLEWLVNKLASHPNRHTLICLHHNLLPTHSTWLDQHSLRNLHDLEIAIQPFANVKAFLHGHIHQEVDADWRGYRVLATPSTCIQFKPYCNNFTLDTLPQGWRELILHPNGEIETCVKRLDNQTFSPDFSALGY